MDIGKNIREMRESQGLMVSEVARRAGLTVSGVTSIETGRVQRPAVQTVVRLARALGVEPGDLLKEEPTTVEKADAPPPESLVQLEPKLERLFTLIREEVRNDRLDTVMSCVDLAFRRADYWQQELERGRKREYATYNEAYRLAVLAIDEFSSFYMWLFDGPARPLWVALEHGVGLEIEEQYNVLIWDLIDRLTRTQFILIEHVGGLAETKAQKDEIAAKRKKVNDLHEKIARRIAR
jgi:transcriptional regulator with XRE-family HTH domain